MLKHEAQRDQEERWFNVRVIDLAVLLHNMYLADKDKDIGHQDAYNSLEWITKEMARPVPVKREFLESALWSSNMLNEKKKFWHHLGFNFDRFLRGMLDPDYKFDKVYNWIVKKKGK